MHRFLTFFSLGIAITSLGLFALPLASDAQVDEDQKTACGPFGDEYNICLSIPILGVYRVKDAVEYINIFYQYFLPILAMLAVLIIMFAGIRWMASSGNTKVIESSKQMISGAIVGLILALTTIVILRFINVSLVELNTIRPRAVTEEFAGNEVYCNEETMTIPDTAKCGDKFPVVVGGKKVDCVVNRCLEGQNCLPLKNGWECSEYKTFCTETDKNKCGATDNIIHTLDQSPETAAFGCARDEQWVDSCIWNRTFKCPNSGRSFQEDDIIGFPGDPRRISCLAATKESVCEGDNENEYEDCELEGTTLCTDKPEAVERADCLCCAKESGWNCRRKENVPLFGCNPDEIPIPNERCGNNCTAENEVCCVELSTEYIEN